MKNIATLLALSLSLTSTSQNFNSYFTGNFSDTIANPIGGVCMMGGATENDNAMKWFLERANGGDVIVLRASGSNGYNDYMYSELGVEVNSVESIVFLNELASSDAYILDRISKAEAIWFAGGDQWNYVDFWRGTEIQDLINEAILERNIVIGGTSAGMAILGSVYFSAENGTVTSASALNDPYGNNVTVDNTPFLQIPYMQNVITDTHYDDPDRKGRHFTFIARGAEIVGESVQGIACEEYTSVCIDENGIASVYGGYPEFEDYAYFVFANCEISENIPEIMEPGLPLTWNQDSSSVQVCKIPGTEDGSNSFDLNDWNTSEGGDWFKWYAEDGELFIQESDILDCNPVGIENEFSLSLNVLIYPNPSSDGVFNMEHNIPEELEVSVFSLSGNLLIASYCTNYPGVIDLSELESGVYIVTLFNQMHTESKRIVILK